VWFKLIDGNKVEIIGKTQDKSLSEIDLAKYRQSNKDNHVSLGFFIKSDSLPDPNTSWPKKRKWFWCDEQEYARWRKTSRNRH
jgi:hypothetical protein